MKSIGFILTRSPLTEPHAATLARLASAAIAQGVQVKVLLALDGVNAPLDDLKQRGAIVVPDLASLVHVDRVVTL